VIGKKAMILQAENDRNGGTGHWRGCPDVASWAVWSISGIHKVFFKRL
jgi:hypothetical protein